METSTKTTSEVSLALAIGLLIVAGSATYAVGAWTQKSTTYHTYRVECMNGRIKSHKPGQDTMTSVGMKPLSSVGSRKCVTKAGWEIEAATFCSGAVYGYGYGYAKDGRYGYAQVSQKGIKSFAVAGRCSTAPAKK